MAWYLWIKPVGELRDSGLDSAKRATCSFTVRAKKTESETFEEELVKVLVDAGVGEYGVTIFASSNARLPTEGPEPFITVAAGDGMGPEQEQNADGVVSYQNPAAYVMARCKGDYAAARAMAAAAYRAFVAVKNKALTA